MKTLVVLLVLVAVGVAVVVSRRNAAARATAGKTSPARVVRDPLASEEGRSDPRRITVADVIMLDGRDFIVRGSIRFEQDGFVWHEHFLDDLELKRWLSVEDDEGLEIVLWEPLKAAELAPGSPSIDHAGVTYGLDEHGRARFTAQGTTGTGPAGEVEYYDYQAGEARLAFERYGSGEWIASLGRVIGEHTLDVYPGSD